MTFIFIYDQQKTLGVRIFDQQYDLTSTQCDYV